jgi:hypothetical protein
MPTLTLDEQHYIIFQFLLHLFPAPKANNTIETASESFMKRVRGMMPVYMQRKKRKQGAQAAGADMPVGLSGSPPAPGIEVLDKLGADAGQWDSAYQQLFDRN